ncbi:MAG: trypsin-like peptidase domain-containing protein [Burkholderiales bacterium]|jgi:serine protease DegQ|nr:trypsin-like peptidase domain-containing protein [Burkholderiales bacterium]
MLRRLWLLFAQAVTVGLAALFIVATLKPEWLRQAPLALSPPAAPAAAVAVAPAAPSVDGTPTYADAAQRALPAVVSVFTTKEVRRRAGDPLFEQFFGGRPGDKVSGLGSGVIATADGYVLTNNHVIEGADEILVALSDGRRVEAKLVGTDPESDVAVLKIDAPNLPAIAFGRAEDLKVGDVVLAIGNPFGVGQTVTAGIVSALGRNNLGINRYENFIQTDAAINQGNSGGALVDARGRLIGINTAIYSRTGGSIGIGFAIPATLVADVMGQLIRTGKVVRGYFGIEPVDVTPELVEALKLNRNEGVLVRGVQRSAPAGKAGMEPGDIVLTINGSAVRDTPDLLAQIAKLAPGSTAQVKVLRRDKEVDLAVEVAERPAAQR